ncbi:MAG: S-ribosylhomocysteine lyase [Lachnospiraceae bacterium]
MKTIASFTVDHTRLLPGIYVSRKDMAGNEPITTFDLRLTRPNIDPVMDTGTMHTIEHLAATFLRNDPLYAGRVIYFGPMGCRTGFYLILAGNYDSEEIVPLIKKTFAFIKDFEGDIPGATPVQCGNYSDMNLEGAKAAANKYYNEILTDITDKNLIYPL